MIKTLLNLIVRCFKLAAPFGKKKLIAMMALIVINGFTEVLGITSILPFLALATNPEAIKEHSLFKYVPEGMTDSQLLWLVGGFSIMMLFVSNGVSLLSQVTRVKFGQNLGHHLREQILYTIVRQPYSYFLKRNSSQLIQKSISYPTKFVGSVFIPLLDIISKFFTISFLVTVVLLANPVIAITIATVLTVFYGSALIFLRKRAQDVGNITKTTHFAINKASYQFFGAIKTVFIHNKRDFFIAEILKNSRLQADTAPRSTFYTISPRALVEPIAFGSIVLTTLILSTRGQSFVEALPILSLMAIAGIRMLPAFQSLYTQLNSVVTHKYAFNAIEKELSRIKEFSEQNPELMVRKGFSAGEDKVKFDGDIVGTDLCFEYPKSKRPIFENLNFHIPKNSSLGIVGSTGSGKSTLVDLILGLHSTSRGSISVNGNTLSPENISSWRSCIAYVPQDIFLLDDTVEANIAFGVEPDKIDHAKVKNAADAAQITEFIESELSEQWKTNVGERGVRLSGGQRQRVGLARALYNNPSVLILDEATSALDNETEKNVMEAINKLQGSLTIIAIAHRLSTLQKMDQILDLAAVKETRSS